tara:strand:- start:575 stop:961 length:387 start_codon:yes stop_codon:yes gene_type:complete
MQARAQLRKKLREARRGLTNQQHTDAAKRIASRLRTLPFLDNSTTIAGYLVNDGEVNLTYFIESIWQSSHDKKFALPVLHPVCKGHLLFLSYTQHSQLVRISTTLKSQYCRVKTSFLLGNATLFLCRL